MTEPTAVANSYIETIEDCDAYFDNDPRAAAFLALDDDPKSWYLQRATFLIDNLPLRGIKFYRDGTQVWDNGRSKAFPREYREGYDMSESTGLEEVPQHIEDACCEEALALYLFHIDSDSADRKRSRDEGVQSFSMAGQISETLGKSNFDRHHGLLSSEAFQLLSKHIARSFPIT